MFTDDLMSVVRAMKEADFNSVTTNALVSLYKLGMAVWEKYLRVGRQLILLLHRLEGHHFFTQIPGHSCGTLLPSKAVSLVFGSP